MAAVQNKNGEALEEDPADELEEELLELLVPQAEPVEMAGLAVAKVLKSLPGSWMLIPMTPLAIRFWMFVLLSHSP